MYFNTDCLVDFRKRKTHGSTAVTVEKCVGKSYFELKSREKKLFLNNSLELTQADKIHLYFTTIQNF